MAFKASFNKNFSIGRAIKKVLITSMTLWIGGEILTQIGNVINGSSSPLYTGFKIIGWTVGANPTNGTHWSATCTPEAVFSSATSVGGGCVTDTSTGTGILTVIGIIGFASVVMEFMTISF